jgi:hypothetical protein
VITTTVGLWRGRAMENTELEAVRAERLRAMQERAVMLGVNMRYLPEYAELFPQETAEAESLRKRQEFAARFGLDWRYAPEMD